jgi:toxin ParE1/3/4
VRQDLIDILRFTVETSGKRQLHTYRDRINDALQAIGRNPAIGQHSQALPETHRLYLVGAHVIVYRDQASSIAAVRILHQRISLMRHV